MEPKIGLALGSGGARGFAHVGVISVLKKHNISIDLIAGSSIGALVAVLYGAGADVDRLYKIAKVFQSKYYIDYVVPKMGLISGNRVKELIKVLSFGRKLEELDLPVSVIATDLLTGEKIVFQKGDIATAVRASISIPGIFVPETWNGRLLVDGGVIDRIPVSVVKEMGADFIIGVDASPIQVSGEVSTIYDVIMQSIEIMQHELVRNREIASNVMIRPKLDHVNSRNFTNLENVIKIGEEATEKLIPEILEKIEQWKEKNSDKKDQNS
ncbi:esterase [Bacillus sp. FJAT-25509]|uniref:patatin-like phospholipase family protein n=1 Tax=Bacillaceae TaxID=186817 RepID=UPI0006FEDF6A|nr:patatin-like phospholipase family protein [Bacillus sp. FJAT-25509]KQL40313.1 esterase [Bacillus sp. FJAT-25509]